MGYFDGLTNGAFKIDEQGRRLFFLYGKLGKARLLPTEADDLSMRAKYKAFYIYGMLFVMPVIVILSVSSTPLIPLILVGTVLLAPAYIWLEIHARKYAKVDGKLTFAESYSNSAAGHNFWTLIVLTFLSSLFVLLGVILIALGPAEARWVGAGCVLLFGGCAGVIGWMARLKVKQRRGKKIS